MSYDVCVLKLHLPDKILALKAYFQDRQKELDDFINRSFYQSLTQKLLEESLKAFVHPADGAKEQQDFEAVYKYCVDSECIVKCSSPVGLKNVYFFIPFRNSKVFGLYKVKIQELSPQTVESCVGYISELIKGNSLIRHNFELASGCITKIESYQKAIKVNCEGNDKLCSETKMNIEVLRMRIIDLYQEFKTEENGFRNYVCQKCETNKKDVIFLPCGHIIFCTGCLKESSKVLVDLPINDSKVKCSVCNKKVRRTIRYII